ncbi:MAG: hypothetical protein ACR2OC_07805 [Solirubrobacterales bacterium]
MATNGNRKPPRPRIELLTPAANAEEAAAITAAIEQFLAETAPIPSADDARANPWQRAALHEGVRAKETIVSPWGEAPWGN